MFHLNWRRYPFPEHYFLTSNIIYQASGQSSWRRPDWTDFPHPPPSDISWLTAVRQSFLPAPGKRLRSGKHGVKSISARSSLFQTWPHQAEYMVPASIPFVSFWRLAARPPACDGYCSRAWGPCSPRDEYLPLFSSSNENFFQTQ